jgi:hypothetical protein
LLERGSASGVQSRAREGRYYIDMSRHDLQSVGNERKIRAKGFDPHHLARLKVLIEEYERKLSWVQWLAAAALAEWTAKRTYAPPLLERAVGSEDRRPGIVHKVAMGLAEEFRTQARRRSAAKAERPETESVLTTLFDSIANFTEVVDGSIRDAEGNEISLDQDELEQNRATDKRRLDKDRFTEEHLNSLISGETKQEASPSARAPEPDAAPAASGDMSEIKARLAKLKQLVDDGLITAADYEAKKSEILSQI